MRREEIMELIKRLDDMIVRSGGYGELFKLSQEIDELIKNENNGSK